MSAYRTRSATKQRRNPLEDVNSLDSSTTSARKKTRSSARKRSKTSMTGENSLNEASVASAADSTHMAELQNFSELNSSSMSNASGDGNDQTATLGDLAKLMQSPEADETPANRRRQTADPEAMGALNAMFNSDSDSDSDSDDNEAGAGAETFNSPAPNQSPKPLKSCISARKTKGAQSVRKGVRFGSPDAAEFDKNMATSAVTPLPKSFSRARYNMSSPETQARETNAATEENDRVLAACEEDDSAAVSSKLTASARRRSMGKSKSSGAARSPNSEKKSLKKLRRSPRLRKKSPAAGNHSTEDFEDALRAMAPLPSPMDGRRRSTMPDLKILSEVDAQYSESDDDDDNNQTNNSIDTEYSQNFDEMSEDEGENDQTNNTSRRLSLSSAASSPGHTSVMSEVSGADLTVPLQSLTELVKKSNEEVAKQQQGQAPEAESDNEEEVSEEYTQDFADVTVDTPAKTDDDHTVELPNLKSLYEQGAKAADESAPKFPDLSHMQRYANTEAEDKADESTEENTVELAPLQALIQSAAAANAQTAKTQTNESVDISDDEDDEGAADAGADHTVPLGTLADLYKNGAPSTPKGTQGVSVSYPTDSPYPGDQSSLMITPEPADESVEPVPVAELVNVVKIDFAVPETTQVPTSNNLSGEDVKVWNPALTFMTERLATEAEEVEKMVSNIEEDISSTNPPLMQAFSKMVRGHSGTMSPEFTQCIATLLAASKSEAELEFLSSFQKSMFQQVEQGHKAVSMEVAAEAAEFANLETEIDQLITASATSASSTSDQVSQNSALEKEQSELISMYEKQIQDLQEELQTTTEAVHTVQKQVSEANEAIATQSAASFAAASNFAPQSVESSGPQQDFVSMYQQLQTSVGWHLESSNACSGTDCYNGTAHTFSYSAASTRVLRRAALPNLEMRVAGNGAVATIRFVARPSQPLAAFWNRVCPAVHPVGCTVTTAVSHIAKFDVACARVAMALEEVAELQTAGRQSGSLVRWIGGGVNASSSLSLLMRFSTNKDYTGPASQFQITVRLEDFICNDHTDFAQCCDVKVIFGVVDEATVQTAIRNAFAENKMSFGGVTRVHDHLLSLATRSTC